jgi:hypothetical protein
MNAFERCLKERRLLKVEPSPEMIAKEMESAGIAVKKVGKFVERASELLGWAELARPLCGHTHSRVRICENPRGDRRGRSIRPAKASGEHGIIVDDVYI